MSFMPVEFLDWPGFAPKSDCPWYICAGTSRTKVSPKTRKTEKLHVGEISRRCSRPAVPTFMALKSGALHGCEEIQKRFERVGVPFPTKRAMALAFGQIFTWSFTPPQNWCTGWPGRR